MCGVLFAVVLFALVLFGERAVRARFACACVSCVRACKRPSRKICEEENFLKFVLQNEGV